MTMTASRPKKSTIVRANRAARLGAMRTAFRVLDVIAPSVGARWALDIWCTLPDNAGRRRDDRPRPGERSTVELSGGRTVAVETWGFGPPVYLMHGWGGWRGQLGSFVAPLVEANRRVVAVDAPGHGESSPGFLGPRRGAAVEFAEALRAAAQAHGAPTAVIGHSLGAATAALAVRDGLAVGRLAFVAPSPDPVAMTDALARHLSYGPRTKRRFLRRLEQVAGRPATDFDLTAMPSQAMPPTMIVHDRRDKEVPYDDAVRLLHAWPEAELVTTEGLGHQRILRDTDVIKLVVDFAVS